MVRASTDPASAHVILDIRPNGTIEFMTRSATGAETQWINSVDASFPAQLRLQRVGSQFTALLSRDIGLTWETVGTARVDLPSTSLMGLVVTSHYRGVLATATFRNITEQ